MRARELTPGQPRGFAVSKSRFDKDFFDVRAFTSAGQPRYRPQMILSAPDGCCHRSLPEADQPGDDFSHVQPNAILIFFGCVSTGRYRSARQHLQPRLAMFLCDTYS